MHCSTARRAERHDALHTVVRDVDTGHRRDRSGSLAVSLRGAERGPGQLRHGEPTRRHADSARRRRARGERIPGTEVGDRGCRGPAGHRSPDPASGVARRPRGARRRPVIARGKPIFNALEDFGSYHLNRRHPRTAVGQRADGRIVMLVVDGRRPGYSAGMTNFELAQAMIRLGVVTHPPSTQAALRPWPSTTSLVTRPTRPASDSSPNRCSSRTTAPTCRNPSSRSRQRRRRRRQADAQLQDRSPVEGRGDADQARRVTRAVDSGDRRPGVYRFDWAGRANGDPEPEGRWRFTVNAVDFEGKSTTDERRFSLNNTLGFITVKPLRATIHRRRGGQINIGFQRVPPGSPSRSRRASASCSASFAARRCSAGRVVATWNPVPEREGRLLRNVRGEDHREQRLVDTELARSFRVRRRGGDLHLAAPRARAPVEMGAADRAQIDSITTTYELAVDELLERHRPERAAIPGRAGRRTTRAPTGAP